MDTLIDYEDWLRNETAYYESQKGNMTNAFDRALVEQIKHNFVGFCDSPVGRYKGRSFTVMSLMANSIDDINKELGAEMGLKILRGLYEQWVQQAGAPDQRVHAGYLIRYAVIPLVKMHLSHAR